MITWIMPTLADGILLFYLWNTTLFHAFTKFWSRREAYDTAANQTNKKFKNFEQSCFPLCTTAVQTKSIKHSIVLLVKLRLIT